MLFGPEQAALPGRLNPIYLEGRPLQLETSIAQQLGLRDGQIVQASVELRGEALMRIIAVQPGGVVPRAIRDDGVGRERLAKMGKDFRQVDLTRHFHRRDEGGEIGARFGEPWRVGPGAAHV